MADATTQEMQEITKYPAGAFSWSDLVTTDAEGAKRFYGALFGWTFQDMPAGEGMIYTFAYRYDKPLVGLMGIPGVTPAWQSYVTSDDADATAAKVSEAGGTVLDGPSDVFDNGRSLRFQDPGGGVLGVWQPYNFVGSGFALGPGVPVWRELWTDNIETALEFYRQVFGWRGQVQKDGDATYGSCHNGDQPVTVIMPNAAHPGDVSPGWVLYFGSADVEADAAKVMELGGAVIYGPTVMGGYPFATCRDPQGADFLIMGAPLAA
jgi:predicted enzyme related to lactoylglutathione lyase